MNPGSKGQIYVDQMFNRATNDTTLTQMNAGVSATQGVYVPKSNGYLLKVGIIITPQAATSLAQQGYVQLVCTSFQPINTQIFPFTGFGLSTAPQASNQPPFEFRVNLAISTALAITGSDIFFYSPVTPNLVVYGVFWSA